MKIAIFGYPRSGTTMLFHIFRNHLREAGIVEWKAGIAEAFNPQLNTLLISENGHLRYVKLSRELSTPQSREARVKLFNKHLDDDYILKCLSFDMHVPIVRNALLSAGYEIVAIERRNPLDAYLSSIIAYHHQVWNIEEENDRPVYEPFVVPEHEMIAHGLAMSYYHHYKRLLNLRAVLYYEDMASQSAEATLKQADLYQEGFPTEGTPTKKLLSSEDKIKLITNLDEVLEHYNSICLTWDMG